MIASTYNLTFGNTHQIDDSLSCKQISDNDSVSRAFFTPRMGNEQQYIWGNIFQFPSSDGLRESVIWRSVLQFDDCVHRHNLTHLEKKKLKNPSLNENYLGFLTTVAANVREKKTSRGHGFRVYHSPKEGEWHAEISIALATNLTKLNREDKEDVRFIMKELFEPNFTQYMTE